jgi:P27 family predicted phage terminase small subunit
MPPARKPQDQLQDQRIKRTELVPVDADHPEMERIVPPAKKTWLKAQRDSWDDFWGSNLAALIERPDLPALERLFDMRDEYVRLMKLYRAQMFVTGSTGQPVISPAFKAAQELEISMRNLEDRLGLTPKARAALGIAIGQARITADELNRRARAAARADQTPEQPEGVVDVDSGGGTAFDGWAPA